MASISGVTDFFVRDKKCETFVWRKTTHNEFFLREDVSRTIFNGSLCRRKSAPAAFIGSRRRIPELYTPGVSYCQQSLRMSSSQAKLTAVPGDGGAEKTEISSVSGGEPVK